MSACIYYTYEYEKKGWTRAKWTPTVSDEPGANVKSSENFRKTEAIAVPNNES